VIKGERCLTIRDSADPLVAGHFTGSFSTKGGTVSKTACIAKGAYTFEMTDMYGDGICYRYGAGEFKITMNSEPMATTTSGEFRDVI
jgi:hypothetical protein